MTETKIDHLSTLHAGDIITFTSRRGDIPMAQTAITTYEILEIYLGEHNFLGVLPMVKLTVAHSLHGNARTPRVEFVTLDEVVQAVENTLSSGNGDVTLNRDSIP